MENWLERFYTQTDPVKRQQLLSENDGETEREEARLRKQLWEARYGKGKPRKDAYVGYLMNLKYIAESGGMDWGGRKKKLAMEAVHGLKLFEFEQKTEMEQELIYQELKNTCRTFIEVSTGGRPAAGGPFSTQYQLRGNHAVERQKVPHLRGSQQQKHRVRNRFLL